MSGKTRQLLAILCYGYFPFSVKVNNLSNFVDIFSQIFHVTQANIFRLAKAKNRFALRRKIFSDQQKPKIDSRYAGKYFQTSKSQKQIRDSQENISDQQKPKTDSRFAGKYFQTSKSQKSIRVSQENIFRPAKANIIKAIIEFANQQKP